MRWDATTLARRAAGVLTAIPVAVAGVSWHALAGIMVAVIIVVATGCWILASNARTRRLALLIRAWRGTTAQPAARTGRTDPPRRSRPAAR